jgi:hypothetical protein
VELHAPGAVPEPACLTALPLHGSSTGRHSGPYARSRPTFGRSPVRESRTPGSVRGAASNRRPYRDIRASESAAPLDLVVNKISYSSPGFVDVTGIGKMMEQCRLFIFDAIDRVLESEDRQIKRESARQEVLAKKIKNAEAFLNLYGRMGVDRQTQKLLVMRLVQAGAFLEGEAVDRKITSIEVRHKD